MMSTKSRDKDAVKTTDSKNDSLSLIKGIGPARRQWLRETFGIETAAHLAASSADEIYRRLKEEQIVSLSKVESWVAQAKEIVEHGVYGSNLKVRENGWKPFASFVVEFQEAVATGERQTKAHHVETDKTIKWAGIEYAALCDWLAKQLGEKVNEPAKTQHSEPQLQGVQTGYSEKLQMMLAKASRQFPEIQKPLLQASSNQQMAVVIQPEIAESTSNETHRDGYSEKLQAILARTEHVRSKTK